MVVNKQTTYLVVGENSLAHNQAPYKIFFIIKIRNGHVTWRRWSEERIPVSASTHGSFSRKLVRSGRNWMKQLKYLVPRRSSEIARLTGAQCHLLPTREAPLQRMTEEADDSTESTTKGPAKRQRPVIALRSQSQRRLQIRFENCQRDPTRVKILTGMSWKISKKMKVKKNQVDSWQNTFTNRNLIASIHPSSSFPGQIACLIRSCWLNLRALNALPKIQLTVKMRNLRIHCCLPRITLISIRKLGGRWIFGPPFAVFVGEYVVAAVTAWNFYTTFSMKFLKVLISLNDGASIFSFCACDERMRRHTSLGSPIKSIGPEHNTSYGPMPMLTF